MIFQSQAVITLLPVIRFRFIFLAQYPQVSPWKSPLYNATEPRPSHSGTKSLLIQLPPGPQLKRCRLYWHSKAVHELLNCEERQRSPRLTVSICQRSKIPLPKRGLQIYPWSGGRSFLCQTFFMFSYETLHCHTLSKKEKTLRKLKSYLVLGAYESDSKSGR